MSYIPLIVPNTISNLCCIRKNKVFTYKDREIQLQVGPKLLEQPPLHNGRVTLKHQHDELQAFHHQDLILRLPESDALRPVSRAAAKPRDALPDSALVLEI